jgi:hypothetical protein
MVIYCAAEDKALYRLEGSLVAARRRHLLPEV